MANYTKIIIAILLGSVLVSGFMANQSQAGIVPLPKPVSSINCNNSSNSKYCQDDKNKIIAKLLLLKSKESQQCLKNPKIAQQRACLNRVNQKYNALLAKYKD